MKKAVACIVAVFLILACFQFSTVASDSETPFAQIVPPNPLYPKLGSTMSKIDVEDNINFTRAMKLTVTDAAEYYGGNTINNIHSASPRLDISAWEKNPDATLRFWIKVPNAVSFELDIVQSGSSTRIRVPQISIPASRKWQEIRIARSEFTTSASFDSSVIQYMRITANPKNADNFLPEGESLLIGMIEFYDDALSSGTDETGGTIGHELIAQLTPSPAGPPVGGAMEKTTVVNNINFTEAARLTVTDSAAYYAGEALNNMHYADPRLDLGEWEENPDATLRFWIKAPRAMDFNMDIIDSDGEKISAALSITGSEDWREIRLARSQFDTNAQFDSSKVQYLSIEPAVKSADNFLAEGESLFLGMVEFYSIVLTGEIDQTGGTITSDPIVQVTSPGPLYPKEGSKMAKIAVRDNKNFTQAMMLTITDAEEYYNGNAINNIHYANPKLDISEWEINPDATLRFWIKAPQAMTFEFDLLQSGSTRIRAPGVSVPASENWQEIRLARSQFIETASFDPTSVQYIRITPTPKNADNFLPEGESLMIGMIELYAIALIDEIDETGGTIELSHDAALGALSVTDADIGEFSPAALSYAAAVDYNVNSVTLSAIANDENALVEITKDSAVCADGIIPLTVGENLVLVTVTAEDGVSVNVYTVTINRSAPGAQFVQDLVDVLLKKKPASSMQHSDVNEDGVVDVLDLLTAKRLSTGS